mmetsp:Transcript_122161/g.390706  ORF Transcript_122161/g.390706 Transcript_122161/m.390706 type:complete len:212 (+) Transcript_122161:702-1337(+)
MPPWNVTGGKADVKVPCWTAIAKALTVCKAKRCSNMALRRPATMPRIRASRSMGALRNSAARSRCRCLRCHLEICRTACRAKSPSSSPPGKTHNGKSRKSVRLTGCVRSTSDSLASPSTPTRQSIMPCSSEQWCFDASTAAAPTNIARSALRYSKWKVTVPCIQLTPAMLKPLLCCNRCAKLEISGGNCPSRPVEQLKVSAKACCLRTALL